MPQPGFSLSVLSHLYSKAFFLYIAALRSQHCNQYGQGYRQFILTITFGLQYHAISDHVSIVSVSENHLNRSLSACEANLSVLILFQSLSVLRKMSENMAIAQARENAVSSAFCKLHFSPPALTLSLPSSKSTFSQPF